MTETELASHKWWESYRETVNSDPELDVRGHDVFSENFYIEIGDERTLIRMHEGNIEDIVPNPALNHRWSFGVEGGACLDGKLGAAAVQELADGPFSIDEATPVELDGRYRLCASVIGERTSVVFCVGRADWIIQVTSSTTASCATC